MEITLKSNFRDCLCISRASHTCPPPNDFVAQFFGQTLGTAGATPPNADVPPPLAATVACKFCKHFVHDNKLCGKREGHRCSSTKISWPGAQRLCLFSVKCSNILLQPLRYWRLLYVCICIYEHVCEAKSTCRHFRTCIYMLAGNCTPPPRHWCCVCMLKYSNKNVMKIWTVMFIDCEIWYTPGRWR